MTCFAWRPGTRFACAAVLTTLYACGDDAEDKPAPKDAGSERDAETPGMMRPTGGRGGKGGAGGTGGSTGGTGGTGGPAIDPFEAAYQCRPPAGDPGGNSGVGASCCAGMGVCRANAAGPGLPHNVCSARGNLRCEPLAFAESIMDQADDGGATGPFEHCRVQLPGAPPNAPDFEGRCVPSCFGQGVEVVSRLQQATCAEAQICVPCFNPLDAKSTGMCELKGDAPAESAPAAYAECGDNLGYCIPAFAAGNSASQLAQLTCAAGELCAPKIKAANPNACFERCVSAGIGAGACVPQWLTAGLGAFLGMETCQPGELCAPCEALGTRTGVCD